MTNGRKGNRVWGCEGDRSDMPGEGNVDLKSLLHLGPNRTKFCKGKQRA